MERTMLGWITVDSGQIFITDPCYLNRWVPGDYRAEDDNSYHRVTSFMLDNSFGEVESGVVVGPFDDGAYPVFAVEDEQGRLLRVEIAFDLDREQRAKLPPPSWVRQE